MLTSCATQNLPVPEPQDAPPLVVKEHPLPPAAEDKVLQSALGEYANDPAVSSLIEAVRTHSPSPLTAGNKVTPLVDGPETFGAIRAAVRSARHHIHVETFIYGDDKLGREFAALLAQKHREGVAVRVLYDSVGSMKTPRAFFDEMRANGIDVREFRPMNPVENPRIWEIQNRDHRKIVIVDGKIGFTGGINIDGTYSSSSSIKPGPKRGIEDGWRDTHARIEGPAVTQLQQLFMQMWNKAGEQTHFAPEYFPTVTNSGKDLVTIVANESDSEDRWLYGTVLAAISHASSRLWITQAYFAPNEDLLNAMIEAARRGVDVRLIVPGFSDSNIVLQASRATYTPLLDGGVHIFERKDALLHAKTIVIDGALSMIGSANLDMRSFVHNDEVNAVVVSRDVGKRMEEVFERDQKAAREITLAEWKHRS
ncbi:MAG: cardiolipin synthase, partial [Steroidobacteraceae bacterium]